MVKFCSLSAKKTSVFSSCENSSYIQRCLSKKCLSVHVLKGIRNLKLLEKSEKKSSMIEGFLNVEHTKTLYLSLKLVIQGGSNLSGIC